MKVTITTTIVTEEEIGTGPGVGRVYAAAHNYMLKALRNADLAETHEIVIEEKEKGKEYARP
jgi:hypothetical protein